MTFTEDFNKPTAVSTAQGKPLPLYRWYRGTLSVTVEDHPNAELGIAKIVVSGLIDEQTNSGQFQDTDGTLFTIGNRKLFDRIWLGYSNPAKDAAKVALTNEIAVRTLKDIAWAAGYATEELVDGKKSLVLDPGFGGDPLLLVKALDGRVVAVRPTKYETYKDKQGEEKKEPRIGAWKPVA